MLPDQVGDCHGAGEQGGRAEAACGGVQNRGGGRQHAL